MKTIEYNIHKYDFRGIVERYLDVTNLETLHVEHKFQEVLVYGTDQDQDLHRLFYQNMDENPEFVDLYNEFIHQCVLPNFNEQVLYQKYPTFRVHQPENLGVFAFHRDSEYNHNPKSINIFMPFTSAFDTNTVWVESERDKEDYSPMNLEYGQMNIWDGANLKHGTKLNETSVTRVSVDFRILPIRHYDENNILSSKSKNRKFVIGDYWQQVK